MTRSKAVLLLLVACGVEPAPEREPEPVTTSGNETATTSGNETNGVGTTITLVSLQGDRVGSVTLSDEEVAELNRRNTERQTREQAEHAEHRAEFQAQCTAVAIQTGPPPAPPPTPRRSSLHALNAVYHTALTPPPALPASATLADVNTWSQTTLMTWINEAAARLSALEQGASSLSSEEDLAVARAWIAHAHGVLVENLLSIAVPAEIENDPELLEIYRAAFREPLRPLVDKALEAVSGRSPRDTAWVQYVERLQRWLTQESCALHPGRP